MQRLALALAILIASALLAFRPVYEPDLGWHLAHGREDTSGRLVRTNVFSAEHADYRQHYTSWLFETVAYAAWSAGGDAGVQVSIALVIAGSLSMLYAACRTGAGSLLALAVLALAFAVIEPRAIPRPHVVSFAGMAMCGWMIQRAIAARAARPLAWAPLGIALWSNAHGECVFGALVIGLFGAAEWLRPSALTRGEAAKVIAIALACAGATLANPYGWGLFLYLYENAAVPQLLAIAELRPAYLPDYLAFFTFAALAVTLLIVPPKRVALWEVAIVAIVAALGWRYLRLTPLLVFAAGPILAARLAAAAKAIRLDARAVFVTMVAIAVLTMRTPRMMLVTGVRAGELHPPSVFSPRALDFVRSSGLSGPLFNSNNLGGWIEWTLYRAARTFQDSRLQAYPRDHFRRILDASRSQTQWNELVAGVDWAMLSSARPNALSGAQRFPQSDWATVFWDEAIEVLVRRQSRYAALAADRGYHLLLPDSEIFELAPKLSSPDGDALRREAARNRVENPDGFAAAAVMCLSNDETACAAAERIGSAWAALDDDLAIVRVLRGKR